MKIGDIAVSITKKGYRSLGDRHKIAVITKENIGLQITSDLIKYWDIKDFKEQFVVV